MKWNQLPNPGLAVSLRCFDQQRGLVPSRKLGALCVHECQVTTDLHFNVHLEKPKALDGHVRSPVTMFPNQGPLAVGTFR